jgi:hypothetical protein
MKAISLVTCALMLCVSTIALSRSERHKPDSQKSDAQQAPTQLAFARLKSLAGNWKGQSPVGPLRVSMRVTSGGSALMHEMVPEGRSDDPTHGDDDPVTMLYTDAGRLMLTHYCDSGDNRPRMVGKVSPDGKTVEFDFLDLSSSTKFGHMHRAVFTVIDADHHTEDWTYMASANKSNVAHIDLVRAK